MGQRTCSIADCDKPAKTRGWCQTHYGRWSRYGDPNIYKRLRGYPEDVRFWSKVDADGDCWVWTCTLGDSGHGEFSLSVTNQYYSAHRWAWEHLVGPIPDGLTLDHLCRNPPCVNPDHLQPVPGRVNILRSYNPAAQNARKTHCPAGHPYDHADGDGRRRCFACRRAYMQEYRRRRQAA